MNYQRILPTSVIAAPGNNHVMVVGEKDLYGHLNIKFDINRSSLIRGGVNVQFTL